VFQVTNASQTGEPVDLSTSGTSATIVTYIDGNQSINMTGGGSSDWLATWLIGPGNLLAPGERAEIRVPLRNLTRSLGVSTKFQIQVKPTVGAVLTIEKTTPAEFTTVMNLD